MNDGIINYPCWQKLMEVCYTKDFKDFKTLNSLAKEMGGTYSHIVHISQDMAGLGLLEYERNGRTTRVTLTPKGRKVGEMLCCVRQLINEGQRNQNEKGNGEDY